MTRLTGAAALLAVGCGGAVGDEAPSPPPYDPADFASEVVEFVPGGGAGFGQDKLPDVVLGPPQGRGMASGSLDVLSLGEGGYVTLGFAAPIIDGPGPDLIVFENAFKAGDGTLFVETARVEASADGEDFVGWPCDPSAADLLRSGCAGLSPTFAFAADGTDALDPATAGGDAFDLAALALTEVRFLRIVDSGANLYQGTSGGFDLDAVAVLHRQP
jgi:hypothetical protein